MTVVNSLSSAGHLVGVLVLVVVGDGHLALPGDLEGLQARPLELLQLLGEVVAAEGSRVQMTAGRRATWKRESTERRQPTQAMVRPRVAATWGRGEGEVWEWLPGVSPLLGSL